MFSNKPSQNYLSWGNTSHIRAFFKLLPLVDYFCSIPLLYEGQNNYACVSDTDSILSYLIFFRPVLYFFYRQVLLPTSSFDTKGKFMTSLSGQYSSGSGSGSFSLSGIMSHKDVADYFKFLKEDYQLGTTRLCKFISHVGYQFGNQWYINEKVIITFK